MATRSKFLFLIRNNYFLLLLFLIHFLFLSIQIINKNLYLVDSFEYLNEAKNISNSSVFYCGNLDQPINNDLYTKRPPIYPLFIAFFKLFVQSDVLIIIVQSIISIFSILLIRKAFLQFGYRKNYDPLFLLMFIFSPAQMIYANLIMSEIIFQFILALGFYLLVKYFQKDSIKYLLYFNICIAFSAFIKPVMHLFVYPSFILMLFLSYRNNSIKPMLIGIIPIIMIQAYSFWNYKRTDYWQFSSIQTTNLFQYNAYYFNVQRIGLEKANIYFDDQVQKADSIKSYPEKQRYLEETSKQVIKENLIGYGWFHFKGMLRFFIDPGRFDISNFFGLEGNSSSGFFERLNTEGLKGVINYLFQQNLFLIVALFLIALVNLIKVAGLILFLTSKQIDLKFRLAIFFIVGYIAFATGPLGASRFMMPLIPLVIFASLISVESKPFRKFLDHINFLFSSRKQKVDSF